jgi:hypothetical protein
LKARLPALDAEDIAVVGGVLLVVVGVAIIYPPASLILGGLLLTLVAVSGGINGRSE